MCSNCQDAAIKPPVASERPDWDHYFMAIAEVAASRSNCSRRHVAAVLVRDKRVISTGYNGTPRGIKIATKAAARAATPTCLPAKV